MITVYTITSTDDRTIKGYDNRGGTFVYRIRRPVDPIRINAPLSMFTFSSGYNTFREGFEYLMYGTLLSDEVSDYLIPVVQQPLLAHRILAEWDVMERIKWFQREFSSEVIPRLRSYTTYTITEEIAVNKTYTHYLLLQGEGGIFKLTIPCGDLLTDELNYDYVINHLRSHYHRGVSYRNLLTSTYCDDIIRHHLYDHYRNRYGDQFQYHLMCDLTMKQ
jgi:hypothetical protein